MIRVCFAGVTGWTAPPILAAIDAADDLTLTAGVSRSAAGQKLSLVTTSTSGGKVYATVADALDEPPRRVRRLQSLRRMESWQIGAPGTRRS